MREHREFPTFRKWLGGPIAEVLRKVVDAVERIVERAARGFLAARLSRWIGRRPAHWLAQRWPRQLLPTRAFWRWAIRQWSSA